MAAINRLTLLGTYIYLRRRRRDQGGRSWVHPILSYREGHRFKSNLLKKLEKEPAKFFNFFRINITSFNELLKLLEPHIKSRSSVMGKSVSPKERLAVTLRYLATGCTHRDLYYSFRIGVSTLSKIIPQVCRKIWEVLRPLELPIPTRQQWENIAALFQDRANFPNCIGALDGKHIRIVQPTDDSGTKYLSFVALSDANYFFTFVDVGYYGENPDLAVFEKSKISKLLNANKLNIPASRPLPNAVEPRFPMVFVGDEPFCLSFHVMRPYSGKHLSYKKRIFNFRHKRARRFIECTYGILTNKWRVLQRPLKVSKDFSVDIVKACVVLHNFVRRRDGYRFQDKLSYQGLEDMNVDGNIDLTVGLEIMRDALSDYFVGHGALAWPDPGI